MWVSHLLLFLKPSCLLSRCSLKKQYSLAMTQIFSHKTLLINNLETKFWPEISNHRDCQISLSKIWKESIIWLNLNYLQKSILVSRACNNSNHKEYWAIWETCRPRKKKKAARIIGSSHKFSTLAPSQDFYFSLLILQHQIKYLILKLFWKPLTIRKIASWQTLSHLLNDVNAFTTIKI